ncbi:hypothetical protein QFC19_004461 [Naganishia cerealis]|uniref:Uncharacterized protein n=1 Tax=Naganishia cerealis TaxID=610337 RepID=A0ACC2VWW5_9TREE|nr:hypothetical protein QFC19_004461 [Naganishia cerealis]
MPMDTSEYLTSRGWKGKGTALKHGHVTRPLAVVQKKTLSGVGKDRDEAVPFWDNIFAAAAINIKVSSETPTPVASGAATPVKGSSPVPLKSSQSSMTAFARGKQEMARRLLYSKFFRGDVLVSEDLDKIPGASSRRLSKNGMEAGSSTLMAAVDGTASLPTSRSTTESPESDGEETKNTANGSTTIESAEAKAQRKAEKASKRAARAEVKAAKLLKKEAKVRKQAEKAERSSATIDGNEGKRKGKDKKKEKEATVSGDDDENTEQKQKRKRSQTEVVDSQGNDDVGDDTETASLRKKKKKKRKATD